MLNWFSRGIYVFFALNMNTVTLISSRINLIEVIGLNLACHFYVSSIDDVIDSHHANLCQMTFLQRHKSRSSIVKLLYYRPVMDVNKIQLLVIS